MRWSIPAALGLLVASAAAAPAGAVVHGTPVDPAAVPWFASLGGCGGTLVAPDRVLTAAHCVAGQTPEHVGGITVGGLTRRATHIAMHPQWRHRNGPANYLDDVAVIELDTPIAGVPTVALGGADPGIAHILGRGRPFAPGTGHSQAETLDGTLRTADLKTIGDAACARAFRGYRGATLERFDARMRCAIDADGLEPLYSGCHGDSGGPLWFGTTAAPVQLGVVSWGGDCGADHRPSVFADVALYRDFITDPTPTWAPTKTGRVRIAGVARAGRTLRCSAPRYTREPGTTLEYSWRGVGTFKGNEYQPPKTLSRGTTYKVATADRGHGVSCHLAAANHGGFVAVGATGVRIAR